MKRLSALLLMILFAFVSVGASAKENTQTRLTPVYTPSGAYSASEYCAFLRELRITGEPRTDIVNAALTQVGYHEGDSESQLGGGNTSGSHNYTEYGFWFGRNVLGNPGGFYYDWCAMFVSWSARQARVPEAVLNNATYAHAGSGGYYFHIAYHPRGSYSPKPGDLVFYDWVGTDRQWDHVGILISNENGVLRVVEGNASERVLIRTVSAYDNEVQGFGAPAYGSEASVLGLSGHAVPKRDLSRGAEGDDVMWLQAALLKLGFASPVDGRFGALTEKLVIRFQTEHGLAADGTVGRATRAALLNALGIGGQTGDPTDPANYPVPTRVLRIGSKGEDVRWLQAALARLGYDLAIDGDFGQGTKRCVTAFQTSHSLEADGIVGPATRNAILTALNGGGGSIPYPEPESVLRRGMRGGDVMWLQAALTRLGYGVSVDGAFGPGTEAKLKAFQRAAGITADGICGPVTVREIKKRL